MPENISSTRAMVLEKIGSGIEFDHERQKLILVGRNSMNMGPRIVRHVKAKDVHIGIKNGFLTGDSKFSRLVSEVVFVQDTEQIVSIEERVLR